MTRARLTVVALLASAGLIIGIARAGAAHASGAAGRAAAIPAVNRRIIASFGAFRRRRSSADTLPASLKSFGDCGGEGPGNYVACDVNRPSYGAPEDLADAANGWRLVVYGQTHVLQVSRARQVPLPDGLGGIWLIPSGRWLCAVRNGPRYNNYYVRMRCGTIGLILRRPPLDFPGYGVGPNTHMIMTAAEPDEVTSAAIDYPGGTESGILRKGALVACIGQGHYELEQTTRRGAHLRPIDVGALGPFKPARCPGLHLSKG